MNNFNVSNCYSELITWTRDWFNQNGPDFNVVIGMSGGKDSTITAALLVNAIGKDRVIGVAMPDDNQGVNDADAICKYLEIKFIKFPIGLITSAVKETSLIVRNFDSGLSAQAEQNVPPRVRMTCLYAIAQSNHAFVVNTCNLCEDYIGYSTKYGDSAGDFSLLANLTVDEILELGDYLKLPKEWVHKTPDDGLPHSQPDEVKIGFSYHVLSDYIRGYAKPEESVKSKIDRMHKLNLHKINPMPAYKK